MFLGGTWEVKISQAKVKRKALPAFRITASQHRECKHCGAESSFCSQQLLVDTRSCWLLWNPTFHYRFHTDKIQDSGLTHEVDKGVVHILRSAYLSYILILFSHSYLKQFLCAMLGTDFRMPLSQAIFAIRHYLIKYLV